jgi:hypothetical protein
MAFDTLSDRLKLVARESLGLCRNNWGGNGLKMEAPIDAKISWRPTFFMKPNRVLILAVEVNDLLFPEILKIAAHDIERYNFPICVYQACSLDVYQKDLRLARVNLLREHGFGIITVDDGGAALIQIRAEPLAQHIPPERIDAELRTLTPRLRVKFRTAYATYQTNVGQGLQEAGQIIEALITCIATQAEAANVVGPGTSRKAAAGIIDDLYQTGAFHNHRAALGGARNFARTYRNASSHPARTPNEAAEKIRKCKTGFFDSLRIAGELRLMIQDLGYIVRIV